MTEALPAPLVPPEVDLRGLEWMPYYGNHLARSEFNARSDDASWRAGHNLWWAAWNCVPAASLPDDEIALARFADLGRDVRAFRKIRSAALHGFIKCSDGRLYHPFLARLALEAWDRRVRERERKARWRRTKDADGDGDKGGDRNVAETGTKTGQNGSGDVSGTDDRKRQDRTGQDITPKPPEPSYRGSEAAQRIVARFLVLRRELWPHEPDTLALTTLETQADQYLADGASEALCLEVIERVMRQNASARKAPPGSLRFCRLTMQDAIAGARAKTAERRPDDLPPEPHLDVHRAQLESWFKTGKWPEDIRGPKPGEPGCRIDPRLLREFAAQIERMRGRDAA